MIHTHTQTHTNSFRNFYRSQPTLNRLSINNFQIPWSNKNKTMLKLSRSTLSWMHFYVRRRSLIIRQRNRCIPMHFNFSLDWFVSAWLVRTNWMRNYWASLTDRANCIWCQRQWMTNMLFVFVPLLRMPPMKILVMRPHPIIRFVT